MSVIIRLQNLPWSANAMDIRTYFRGLSIPEGGVHIVGGEMGDAFIAFSTDEDARQAMMSDGGKIKDVQVKLFLSSRAEMQKIIEAARQQAMAFMGIPTQPPIITNILPQTMPQPEISTKPIEVDGKDDCNTRNDDSKENGRDTRAISRDDSSKRSGRDRDRSTRSRSRDRRRERSRSRERRERRRRERSRSRDRRSSRRSGRRDRSRDRSRTRERDSRRSSRRDDSDKSKSNSGSPVNKKSGNPIQVWDNSSNGNDTKHINFNGTINQQQPTPTTTFNSWSLPPPINISADQLSRLQNLEGRRNPAAFQNTTSNSSFFNQDKPLMLNSTQGTCIHMINLDQTTSYGEIRAIFSKLQIAQNGIKIVNDKRANKRTAYVRFTRLDHKIQALACNGQQIRGKLVEVRTIDDQQFEEAVDSCRPPAPTNSASIEIDSDTDGELHIADESNGNNKKPDDGLNLGFTVLKLDGVPTFAKEHHIMKMFSDYSVANIHVVENGGSMCPKESRRQHLAYVEFHRPADAAFALNDENRHVIGHKTIAVTSCSKREMQDAKNGSCFGNKLFSGNNLDSDDMKTGFLKDPRQKRMDDINAKFLLGNNSLMFDKNRFNNQMPMDFNSRPPVLINQPNIEQSNDFQDTDWVVLTNLPIKISDRDIMDFFSDVGLVPSRLHLLPGNQTGGESRSVDGARCYCRFEGGPDDVRRACTKDGMPLGMSRISVAPVKQSVVESATGSKEAPPSVFLKPPPIINPTRIETSQPPPQHSQAPPLMNLNISQPFNGPQTMLGHNAPPMMMRGDAHMGMRRPPPVFPGRGGRGAGRGLGFPARGGRGGGGIGGQFNGMGGFPRNQGPDSAGVDGFGAPGCVVSMENVPFRAGVEEILEFFRGFDIPRENIIRRFNDQGNPTGDAKVAFSNPQDAKRAVETRLARGPNCKIRDRRIYLTIT